jgi:hypothetical protein
MYVCKNTRSYFLSLSLSFFLLYSVYRKLLFQQLVVTRITDNMTCHSTEILKLILELLSRFEGTGVTTHWTEFKYLDNYGLFQVFIVTATDFLRSKILFR